MGLDSVELVMEVEKHFSISIPNPEAEKAYTVGKLVDCVAKIMGVTGYDFSLRENTFALVKKAVLDLDTDVSDFSINSPISQVLNINDKPLMMQIEGKTKSKFPGIGTRVNDANGALSKLKSWFSHIDDIDLRQITWKKYTDIILAENLENLSPPIKYNSKYEIYIAIMRITVDKIGVNYQEMGIDKSFTDDLGVD